MELLVKKIVCSFILVNRVANDVAVLGAVATGAQHWLVGVPRLGVGAFIGVDRLVGRHARCIGCLVAGTGLDPVVENGKILTSTFSGVEAQNVHLEALRQLCAPQLSAM
jgi:hypothetical protein